ncbi:MAG: HIT domain-containing protein [Rickettsiales bacterium]
MYDDDNVFAKIIRRDIPAEIIAETEEFICFEDIAKVAPIHWLAIPKTKDMNFSEFAKNNSQEKLANFFKFVQKIISDNNLEKKGYKLITNCGEACGQTVFHFHLHIVSGKKFLFESEKQV